MNRYGYTQADEDTCDFCEKEIYSWTRCMDCDSLMCEDCYNELESRELICNNCKKRARDIENKENLLCNKDNSE